MHTADGGMRVGQPQSLARQAIEMRCGNAPGGIERADVAVAKIVSQDQDDVGTGLRGAVGCRGKGEEDDSGNPAHAGILHGSAGAINRAALFELGLSGWTLRDSLTVSSTTASD